MKKFFRTLVIVTVMSSGLGFITRFASGLSDSKYYVLITGFSFLFFLISELIFFMTSRSTSNKKKESFKP